MAATTDTSGTELRAQLGLAGSSLPGLPDPEEHSAFAADLLSIRGRIGGTPPEQPSRINLSRLQQKVDRGQRLNGRQRPQTSHHQRRG